MIKTEKFLLAFVSLRRYSTSKASNVCFVGGWGGGGGVLQHPHAPAD